MTTTLTDRYVAATLQRVPAAQRADIASELRAAILDSIDAQVASGADPDEAERTVLTELGDPERLAADYTERPLQLIGPRLYLRWLRTVKWLMIIPVAIASIDAISTAASAGSLADVIGSAASTALSLAIHVAFWTTVVFALIDRYDSRESERLGSWTIDALPEETAATNPSSDAATNIAFAAFFIAALIIGGREVSAFGGDTALAVIDPALWSLWLPVLIGALGLGILVDVARLLIGRWTYALAGINTLAGLAFTVPAAWLLLTDRFLDPEFVAHIEAQTGTEAWSTPTLTVATLVIIGVAAWDIVDGFAKAHRARALAPAG